MGKISYEDKMLIQTLGENELWIQSYCCKISYKNVARSLNNLKLVA